MKCDLSFKENREVPSAILDVIETAALRICDVNAKSSFEGNLADNSPLSHNIVLIYTLPIVRMQIFLPYSTHYTLHITQSIKDASLNHAPSLQLKPIPCKASNEHDDTPA